jgi:transposase
VEKIPKPDYWCKEWYIEQKENGYSDSQLAEQLHVHINTFNRWKKELQLPRFAYTYSNGKGLDNRK